MEKSEVFYHFPDIIHSFPVEDRFKSSLAGLSIKDYNKPYFKKDIPAIELDSYKQSINPHRTDRSIDALVGVTLVKQGKAATPKFLLVELRLRYKTDNNLHSTEIKQKIEGSIDLIKGLKTQIGVAQVVCLIFNNKFYQQSINWLQRQKHNNKLRTCEAFNPDNFCNFINLGKDLKFEPTKETKSLCQDVIREANLGNWSYFLDNFEKLRNYFYKYIKLKELNECKFIAGEIHKAVEVLRRDVSSQSEDDKIIQEFICDEFSNLIKDYI